MDGRIIEGFLRSRILYHAAFSFMLGLIWSAPSVFFSFNTSPVEVVAIWTLTSCFTTAIAIGYHSTPPCFGGVSSPPVRHVFGRHDDRAPGRSVADRGGCDAIRCFSSPSPSLRQAHQFGEQLSTYNELCPRSRRW